MFRQKKLNRFLYRNVRTMSLYDTGPTHQELSFLGGEARTLAAMPLWPFFDCRYAATTIFGLPLCRYEYFRIASTDFVLNKGVIFEFSVMKTYLKWTLDQKREIGFVKKS